MKKNSVLNFFEFFRIFKIQLFKGKYYFYAIPHYYIRYWVKGGRQRRRRRRRRRRRKRRRKRRQRRK